MREPKTACIAISGSPPAWLDRRFVRWWDSGIVQPLVFLAVFCTGIAYIALDRSAWREALDVYAASTPWTFGITTISVVVFLCVVSYICIWQLPFFVLYERKYASASRKRMGHRDTHTCTVLLLSSVQEHSDRTILCDVRTPLSAPLGDRLQDAVHAFREGIGRAAPGILDTSLIIEDCRKSKSLTITPHQEPIATIVCQIIKGEPIAADETELLLAPPSPREHALSILVFTGSMVFFLAFTPILLGARGYEPGFTEAYSFGVVLFGEAVFGYLTLRLLDVFPLPLFRGECSAEKTRVFHGFRWKTFKPGRDLAIVRFTSNQEADIAFLGADGSHATARAGGKYLKHFIACWAAPAHTAGNTPSL